MVANTFARVDSLTCRCSLITCDTVIGDTPAAFATSCIVTTTLHSTGCRPPARATSSTNGALITSAQRCAFAAQSALGERPGTRHLQLPHHLFHLDRQRRR